MYDDMHWMCWFYEWNLFICKYREISDLMKGQKISTKWKLLIFQEGLCSSDLVRYNPSHVKIWIMKCSQFNFLQKFTETIGVETTSILLSLHLCVT